MLGRSYRLFPSTNISNAIRQLTVHEGFLETDIRLKHLPENAVSNLISILLGKKISDAELRVATEYARQYDRHLGNHNSNLILNALNEATRVDEKITWMQFLKIAITGITLSFVILDAANDFKITTEIKNRLSDLLPDEETLDKANAAVPEPSYYRRR